MPKQLPNEVQQPAEQPTDAPNNWEADQKNHGYYYDDSHGYETYVPDHEEDDADEDDTKSNEKGTPTE